MSDMLVLATAIQNLADAIIATGAVMGSAEVPSSPRSEVSNDPAEPPKATRKKTEPKADTKSASTEDNQTDSGDVADLIPQIKKLGLEVAKDNRDGVVSLLKEFDVPEEKLGNVPAAQQADFLARLQILKEEGDLA